MPGQHLVIPLQVVQTPQRPQHLPEITALQVAPAAFMPEQRVAEAKKLGFETCVVPEVSLDMVKGIRGIKVIGVKNISDAMNLI